MGDEPAEDHRAHRVQLVLEPRRHAEVPAAAAHGPEEIGMLVRARAHDLTGGGDELHGAEAVHRHAVLAH